jgi:hypothetical protein
MSEDKPAAPTPASRPMPWRWMLFGVGLLAVVILLTMFAMDRVNVVWEDGIPHCPYCRTRVREFATVCATCRQSYDWVAEVALCDLCLTGPDVTRIRTIPEETRRKLFTATLGADREQRVEALLEWTREIEAGECPYCGGTGDDLFASRADVPNGSKERPPCPVCDGDGDCVLCDGDEKVRRGDPEAHADLLKHRDRVANLRGRLGTPSRSKMRSAVRDALETLRGRIEAGEVVDADGRPALQRAAAIREEVLRLLTLPSAER